MNKYQLLSVCFFAGALGVTAQNNTVAAGGVATGPGGSASYSIGQIDYTTATGTGGVMTEGNQQPIEIFTQGVDDLITEKITASVWPNPTSNGITLSIDGVKPGEMFYILFDEQGKLIEQQGITSEKTSVDMATMASGVYILKVSDKDSNKTKTFKIVKNN